MTEYVVAVDPDQTDVFAGTTVPDPAHIAGTWDSYGRCDFELRGGVFDDPLITGFKVVFDASAGEGTMFWVFDWDNPGWPNGDPHWTAEPPYISHITVDSSDYGGDDPSIHVNGPTHYEWVFYWPGDPTFKGNEYNDPLSDLLISLRDSGVDLGLPSPPGPPHPINYVVGSLQAVETVAVPIVVTRFDLVLFTPEFAAPGRLYPREDGLGLTAGRSWPPARSQQSGRYGGSHY
jgi:hypothetical protein